MIRRCVFLQLLLSAAIAGIISTTAFAQYNTAEISGIVHDSQGGALPGATITATHLPSGQKTTRTSDGGGRFLLPALSVGPYVVVVELEGFKRFVQEGLVLAVGQRIELPVTLQIGQFTEALTITAPVPLLQTSSADMSDVISNRQLVQMPLNGRQFLQLAQLTDGIAVPPGGTRGAALEQAGSLPAVYGQRSGHNIYLLDGVKVTDEYFNNLVVSPSIDSIQEFKIEKTMYPAEFGGKSSALINVVTKSGGNAFHVTGLEFARDDRFDARNYFDDPEKPVPPLRQHNFGANIGGPLQRDRSFFFFSYEGQRQNRALTQTFSVPTAALRAGDFSAQPALCDPTTRTASGCLPFSGNVIPASRLDPVALAMVAKVPLPTSAGGVQNLLAVDQQVNSMNQFSLRLDHRLTANDSLYGRLTTYRVRDDQPFGTSQLNETLVPGFGRSVTTESTNVAVGHTHVFGGRVLNEIRFGYLGAAGGQVSPNAGLDFSASSRLQGVTADPRDMGYPQASFGGRFSTIGDPTSFVSRDDRSVELYDNVLIDRGVHRVKVGAYLFHLRFNPVNPNMARGAFTFNGQWTGDAFADFLLGYPSAAQVGIGRADEHGRTTWFHAYGQDDWEIRPNLTLSYGLRYEINGQMHDEDNRLSAIDLSVPGGRFVIASDDRGAISPASSAYLGQIPIPYVTSRDAGWNSSLLRPSYRRFAPRAGFAWAPGEQGDTVITGGFGVFLNQWAYSVQQSLAATLPFFFTKTVNAPADALQPTLNTETALLAPANGSVGGSTMDHDFRTEYAKNYSLAIQQALTPSTMVAVSFLRSAIVGADSSTVLNVPLPGPGAIGPRRPVSALSNISSIRWDGYSVFNGLTFRGQQIVSRGLTFSASYTLSEAIDDASDPGTTASETNLPQDVRNMAAERADASFDHRHRLVGNFSYELPHGWMGGGWRVSGVVNVQSGAPFTVNLGTDRANIGSGPAQRPDVVCDPNQGAPKSAAQWFNVDCFALPAAFTFGNSGRSTVLGPGFSTVDTTIQKDLDLGSNRRLEFRWEIYNLLNTVNFDIPNRIAFTPNFGRIFSAQPARQMQFGVKLLF
jgi:hypothetical protein